MSRLTLTDDKVSKKISIFEKKKMIIKNVLLSESLFLILMRLRAHEERNDLIHYFSTKTAAVIKRSFINLYGSLSGSAGQGAESGS